MFELGLDSDPSIFSHASERGHAIDIVPGLKFAIEVINRKPAGRELYVYFVSKIML
jgi:hypothetical protein